MPNTHFLSHNAHTRHTHVMILSCSSDPNGQWLPITIVQGMLNIKSSSEVCRDRTQVYNMKRYKGCTSSLTSNCNKDLVYDLLEQHYTSESDFVCNVCFDDSVMSVVGLEQQFSDIECFCAMIQLEVCSVSIQLLIWAISV